MVSRHCLGLSDVTVNFKRKWTFLLLFPMLHCSLSHKKCTKWPRLISFYQPCVFLFFLIWIFLTKKLICAFVPVSTYNLNTTVGGKKSYTMLYVETYQDMKKIRVSLKKSRSKKVNSKIWKEITSAMKKTRKNWVWCFKSQNSQQVQYT